MSSYKNKKLSHEDEVILRSYSKMLPTVLENTHEIHIMTGNEVLEFGHVEYEGEKVVPDKKYNYSMPVQIATNHYRRLKRAWLKDGEAGVIAYVKEIADLIEKNKTEKCKN